MSQQIQISGGAKVRDLQDVIIGTSGVLSSLAFNVANGVPKLDVNGKILVSQLPNSVMEYKGVWNAATNTPTLANGTGNQGDVYLCNVAGTTNFGAGPIAFVVGDQVIYSSVAEGSIWQRASGATGTVTSVAVTESGDSLNITGSPITTSGTINIGFNGTNLQYVNGAGNLTTFPILTGYVPYTGATQDVDLNTFKLNAQSIHAKGTGGLGHFGMKHQSASATASANEVSLFADSLGDFSWLNGNLYLSKFITSGNTAARSYTFPNANGTVALTSDLANYVDLTTAQTIGGTKTFSDATKNNGGIFLQNASSNSLAGYMNIGGLTNGVKFTSGGGISNTFTLPSATGYTFTFPNATGTIALTSDLTGGTVTSVAALTIGTSGTDLSSSVANSTTTPVITLNVPTASATNRGALSSADWTAFNNKQSALTNPVLASGTWTSGYLPKINGTYTIGNSIVQDDATTVTIGGQLYVNRNDSNVIKVARNGGSNLNTVIEFANASSSVHIGSNGTLFGLGGTTGSVAAQPFIIVPSSSEKLRLDASGNLGLGVTPSAWQNTFGSTAFQLYGSYIYGYRDTNLLIGNNAYYDGTWKYYASSIGATKFNMGNGAYDWSIAPSGTAGAAITFTQAMTLTASGRLLINKTNEETYQLDVNGTGRFSNSANNATLTVLNNNGYPSIINMSTTTATSTARNWAIFTNGTNWGDLEFRPSAANGGDPYTTGTVALRLASTGAATFSSSVSVNGIATSANYKLGVTSSAFISGSSSKGVFITDQPTYASIVGINSAISSYNSIELRASGVDGQLFIHTSGRVLIGTTSDGGTHILQANGSIIATGFFESSDSRLKTLIQDNYQTKGIASITPKLYTKNGKVELGYYAQDFVGILDSAVSKGSDDMLSLSYREVLVAKVYALEQEIKELKAKMN